MAGTYASLEAVCSQIASLQLRINIVTVQQNEALHNAEKAEPGENQHYYCQLVTIAGQEIVELRKKENFLLQEKSRCTIPMLL